MDLKDEIISTLAPDSEEEVIKTDFNPVALFSGAQRMNYEERIRSAGEILEITDSDRLVYATATFTAAESMRYGSGMNKLLFLAIEYKETGDSSLKEEIVSIISKRIDQLEKQKKADELRNLFPSSISIFDYLSSFFEDDLLDEIIEITAVSKPTAKRYINGKTPRSDNYNMFYSIAKIFFILENDRGMSKEKVIDWYKTHDISGDNEPPRSLRDLVIKYRYFPYAATSALEKEGIVIS